jgi:hypothetical protein
MHGPPPRVFGSLYHADPSTVWSRGPDLLVGLNNCNLLRPAVIAFVTGFLPLCVNIHMQTNKIFVN